MTGGAALTISLALAFFGENKPRKAFEFKARTISELCPFCSRSHRF
jgi:hypothetical protein